MIERKPDARTQRHDALTDAARAVVEAEALRRDAKTAQLKEAHLTKPIKIEPEKPKRKP